MDNLAYSKIDGLNSKEVLGLTCIKKNPLVLKNFTVKSIGKDGFVCVMENDSMQPAILEKDIFLFKPFKPEDFIDGKLYVVCLKNEYLIYIVVKRVFRGRHIGELLLKFDNREKYNDDIVLKCRPEDIIVGKLTSLYRIYNKE